ncbi:MAG: hypothetical protein CVU05_02595 [Bacteroidetes bacterium HGW-Bacteroidetes-21]|nr:MAG: hypothetical protein CVU05_02595 [Bacteroidetes bacterium HGW-Bacteroidetes-21]
MLLLQNILDSNLSAQNNSKGLPQNNVSTNNTSPWKGNPKSNTLHKDDTIPASATVKNNQPEEFRLCKGREEQVKDHPEKGLYKLSNSPNSYEETQLRGSNSRTFKNPDNSFTKVHSSKAMHYKNEQGDWITIDGTLSVSANNSNILEISKTDLPISFDFNSGSTNIFLEKGKQINYCNNVKMVIYDSKLEESSRQSSDIKKSSSSVNSNKLVYKNVWENIDRVQHADYWYVKTDYIINSKPEIDNKNGFLAYEDEYEIPENWQIIKSIDGVETKFGFQGNLIILNEKGAEVGRFNTPIYYDNSLNSDLIQEEYSTEKSNSSNNTEKERSNYIYGAYKITKSNNKYLISVIVPLHWLLNKDRVYPVTIDPTISNTYSTGNINSCYYPTFNTVNMTVSIPAGSTVTSTNSSCTYVAVSPSWMSDGWIGFQSGSNLDGYWYCNVSSPGTCNVTGTSNSTIANGTYSNGSVPFSLNVSRDYPSGTCSAANLYVTNYTWTETVTYTIPCTVPNAPVLASPANNSNAQPGKTIHFTWNEPTTGTAPFTYSLYYYNGSSWQNWSAGSNTFYDLKLEEYGSNSWCGTNTQWYVKATNSCGNTNSETRNIVPYPKYSGSTPDYSISPSSVCQTSGPHTISQGNADYYSFNAIAGTSYYFSTCGSDLGCGNSAGWDTYMKIYGTNNSCTTSNSTDDGSSCSDYETFIDGWQCAVSGTYYLQITGYNSSEYGTYNLQYKSCVPPISPVLTFPANNAYVQPGKTTNFTWNAPITGTGPYNYTFYLWNGSSWLDFDCDTNRFINLILSEYNSASWCGVNAQWYVSVNGNCGEANSSTNNLLPFPKYIGSVSDFNIIPTSTCQSTGSHLLVEGGANYYSFHAEAGNVYYFSTCSANLGCGSNTGWDTYLKLFGTNGSCSVAAYNDDGGSCSNLESFINGWTCTTSGTYYLQITGYNSSAYGNYYLQYKSTCTTLMVQLSGGISNVCYNTSPSSFSVSAIGGSGVYTYLWYLNGVSTGITTSTYTAPALLTNSTVYCAVSSCGQTLNTQTYNITVYSVLNANISGGLNSVCSNNSPGQFVVNPQGGNGSYTYLWYLNQVSTGITTQTFDPGVLTNNSTIYCQVTNPCGVINSNEIVIAVNQAPIANAGLDVSICNNSSSQLQASGGTSYQWTPVIGLNNSMISNPIANPSITTVYIVLVTNQYGCTDSDSVQVTVNSLPIADAGQNHYIYNGQVDSLTASGGVAYLWSTNEISQMIIVSPTVTTTYYVTVTGINGCTGTDNVVVSIYPTPIIDEYCLLTKKKDGGLIYVDNTLSFRFDEEYNTLPTSKLNFQIKNSTNQVQIDSNSLNVSVKYGYNKYDIDISSLPLGDYILEVTDDHKVKYFMNFKKQAL